MFPESKNIHSQTFVIGYLYLVGMFIWIQFSTLLTTGNILSDSTCTRVCKIVLPLRTYILEYSQWQTSDSIYTSTSLNIQRCKYLDKRHQSGNVRLLTNLSFPSSIWEITSDSRFVVRVCLEIIT